MIYWCAKHCRRPLKTIMLSGIRFTPADFRNTVLRPAGYIWTALVATQRTARPIRFYFPLCYLWNIILWPAPCVWTPSGAILMAVVWHPWAPFSWLSGSLDQACGASGHFSSLSGKSCEKIHKWRSNQSSKWDVFLYILDICITLRVLLRELGWDLFLCVLFAVFCEGPESGICILPRFLSCQMHITDLGAEPDFMIFSPLGG